MEDGQDPKAGCSFWDKWYNACKNAGFYRSEKNTPGYWDNVALSDGGGLSGEEHIMLLKDYLLKNRLIGDKSTLLDIGCGGGDYVVSLAKECGSITALDYSEKMLDSCKERCREQGLNNVSFVLADFMEYDFAKHFDCVMSCLNPSAYRPDALDKMVTLAGETVVYFSMDTSLEQADMEPVYRGCNSVRYAEEYLKEKGILYHKLPYVYEHRMENGEIRRIAFAYLVIKK